MGDLRPLMVFVSSHSYNDIGGVFTYQVDVENRDVEQLHVKPVPDPMFLIVSPIRNCLYTANGGTNNTISAFRFDKETGELKKINDRPSGGTMPCYLSINNTGEFLFASNYGDGTVAIFPIKETGGLGEVSDIIKHKGSSVDHARQQEPHPHSIAPDPRNCFVYAADLGADCIFIYELDLKKGRLRPASTRSVETHPGAGPRHIVFHPNGRLAYVINELDSTLTAFGCTTETGTLRQIETVSTIPPEFEGTNLCADVQVHPSGRWIYGTNRGHDSIAIFEIDEAEGSLYSQGYESTHGSWPRDLAFTPRGGSLLAGNQKSDSVVVFDVDENNGHLSHWSNDIIVPEPMCIEVISTN